MIGFALNVAPTVDAGGPYTVAEGGIRRARRDGQRPDGDALTYAWDLDDNGSFETPGGRRRSAAAALDGPSTRTVRVRVTDSGRAAPRPTTRPSSITNVAPERRRSRRRPPRSRAARSRSSITGATDPSAADTAAGFTYAFDCGNGLRRLRARVVALLPGLKTVVERSVGGKIRDKDGGVTEYRGPSRPRHVRQPLRRCRAATRRRQKLADDLCHQLELAEEAIGARHAGGRAEHLDQFAKILDKRGGGRPHDEEITTLLRLVAEL